MGSIRGRREIREAREELGKKIVAKAFEEDVVRESFQGEFLHEKWGVMRERET